MSAFTLPLPKPLYHLAQWAGFPKIEEDEKERIESECTVDINITNSEERPLKMPTDSVSLNTPLGSLSATGSVTSNASLSESDSNTPETVEFERVRERYPMVCEKAAAPAKRVLFPDEFGQPASSDASEDEATQKCAATLTRLMMLKTKITGEMAQAKAVDTVVVSSKDLKDENLKLRLEISELQKQVQERDEYIERSQLGWKVASWNPMNVIAPTPFGNNMAAAMAATPRTAARELAATCSTWLATPVPLGEEAVPGSGIRDKLITL